MEDENAGEAVSASKRHKSSNSENEEIVVVEKTAAGDSVEGLTGVNIKDANKDIKGHDCDSHCLPSAEIGNTDNNNETTAGTVALNVSNAADNKVDDSIQVGASSGKQFTTQNDGKSDDIDNEPSTEQDSGLSVDVTNLSTESTTNDDIAQNSQAVDNKKSTTMFKKRNSSRNIRNSIAIIDSDDDMDESAVVSPLNESDPRFPFSPNVMVADDSSDDSSLLLNRSTGSLAPDVLMADSTSVSSNNSNAPSDANENGALNNVGGVHVVDISDDTSSPLSIRNAENRVPDMLIADSSSSSVSPTNRNSTVDEDENGALNGDADAAAAGRSGNNDGDDSTDSIGWPFAPLVGDVFRQISLEGPLLSSSSSSPSSSPSSSLFSDLDASMSTLPVPSPGQDPIFSPPDSDIDSDDNNDSDSEDNYDDNATNANHAASPSRADVENRTKEAVEEILKKEKSAYAWHSTRELMWREHGLNANRQGSIRGVASLGFNSRFYSSRHVVERMKFSHMLRKHTGCVNCLNFNRAGDLLCSGSDDTRIVVWDWAKNEHKHVFDSGHTANIFQAKFLDTSGCIIIISASRDGQVRRSVIPSSGGRTQTECLYKHTNSVHKIVISPQNNNEIISAGEDAIVMHYDLRTNNDAVELTKVYNSRNKKVRLYSISHHPFAPEFCVSGHDSILRVYDRRNCAKPVREMYPESLNERLARPQITCAVYNNTGTEILASYSDEHIYLFDNKNYKSGEFLHRYRGHYNHRTIKGVNFFGPNSEYIVSGSDCGHIFYWDKETEAILNFMAGDRMGVVNCLEPHPSVPILATSGLDNNVKIWSPNSETYPPDLKHLERSVHRNLKRSAVEEIDFDDRQFHYLMRQFFRSGPPPPRSGSDDSDDSDQSVVFFSSSSSGSNDGDGDGDAPLETLHCRTQ